MARTFERLWESLWLGLGYQAVEAETVVLLPVTCRCIKPGVDNIGHSFFRVIGATAGDAHCQFLTVSQLITFFNDVHARL